ncbi:MAG: hypothetical protein KF856_05560 [Cyclobacteriaceae bacterium]|nr:hypothetical protein [Cyclobacteriaceae bacterium]
MHISLISSGESELLHLTIVRLISILLMTFLMIGSFQNFLQWCIMEAPVQRTQR